MTEQEYLWATECLDCGDGLRRHETEEEARAQYERDALGEAHLSPDERHTHALRRCPVEAWETVTTTAWDGSRSAPSSSLAEGPL